MWRIQDFFQIQNNPYFNSNPPNNQNMKNLNKPNGFLFLNIKTSNIPNMDFIIDYYRKTIYKNLLFTNNL
ncbi:hypothetical protein C9439_03040 [archaeon SCG-AAA382B04]|nr:hypothetical protein C9439_03040 [archaeon SCG-AAA382B04]